MVDLTNTLMAGAVGTAVLPIAFLLARGCLLCLVRSLARSARPSISCV